MKSIEHSRIVKDYENLLKKRNSKYKTSILKISAKCSDLCFTEYTDSKGNKTESDSYVPQGIGIDEDGDCGDYVSMEIDMKTGQILNWKPVTDAQVIAAQKKT